MALISTETLNLSGDGNSGSYVWSYVIKPDEVNTDVKSKTEGFHFVFNYEGGDESQLTLEFFWSDPDIMSGELIAITETDADNKLIPIVRYLENDAYMSMPISYSIPVPACAEKVWIKITADDGTPSGTIQVEGDYDSFKERG